MNTSQPQWRRFTALITLSLVSAFALSGCLLLEEEEECEWTTDSVEQGSDSNFPIKLNRDEQYCDFDRKTEVLSVPVYATDSVSDAKLLHASNVLAQYLDNNEDSSADNPSVHDTLKSRNASLVLFAESEEDDIDIPDRAQGLVEDGINPGFNPDNGPENNRFDATLEEAFHLVTHEGYAHAYSEQFAESQGSDIADALNAAWKLGPENSSVPPSYESGAWFTYNDESCDFGCMVTEYFYWTMTSYLGAHESRGNDDGMVDEWKLYTKDLLVNGGTVRGVSYEGDNVVDLLTNADYKLPSTLPTGVYNPQ